MKTIEETIQEILAEQHECRWLDTSELEVYLRKIVAEQKAIDDDENGKALLYAVNKTTERVKRECINKAYEWLKKNANDFLWDDNYYNVEELVNRFRKAMEE